MLVRPGNAATIMTVLDPSLGFDNNTTVPLTYTCTLCRLPLCVLLH